MASAGRRCRCKSSTGDSLGGVAGTAGALNTIYREARETVLAAQPSRR
jgi:hypothetical protein